MHNFNHDNWLASLKVGDRVVLRNRRVDGEFGPPNGPAVYRIECITAKRTRFDLVNHTGQLSLNRHGMLKTGKGAWSHSFRMEPHTPSIDAEIARDDQRIRTSRQLGELAGLLSHRELKIQTFTPETLNTLLTLSGDLIKLLQANKS